MADEKKGPTIVANTGSRSMNTLAALAALQGKPEPLRNIIPIDVEPTLTGKYGKAWKCDLERMRREMEVSSEADSTLVHWVVEAPWAHPIWDKYSIVLIHTRPLPKNPAPFHFHLNGATHEIWVMACDPSKDLTGMVRGDKFGQQGAWLSPKNFGSQMIYRGDAEAEERIETVVKEILAGTLSPDTDFQGMWVERFGDVMVKPEYRR